MFILIRFTIVVFSCTGYWIVSSSGIRMLGMLERLLTPPSEPVCLDLDLPMNLDPSWGWGASSRARKSCTAHCFLFSYDASSRISSVIEPCHFLTWLRMSGNLSSLCAPYRNMEPFHGFSICTVSPSPHRIRKQHQQKVVFPKFQNVNRTAFLLGIKHDHQRTKIDLRIKARICKVKQVINYQSHE